MAAYGLPRGAAALALALALISCATREAPPVAPVAPPVAEAPPPRPVPPLGASERFAVPARGADGGYVTVNSGIGADEAPWHLRAALNVAALGCRGAEGTQLVGAYNQMLKVRAASFASAEKAIKARMRVERGADWQDAHDDRMTRLYNFFALPPVQQRFCAVAAAVSAREAGVAPADFRAFAVSALDELSQPFTDFFRAYDQYRVDLAAWDARYGAGTAVASASAPVAPAARSVTVALDPPAHAPTIAYAGIVELERLDDGKAVVCAGCARAKVASR